MENDDLWYKNAVFYELYVRAFKDSNGDGKGDLKGAIQKLDYLKNLGVTCLWLLPIYPSPLRDDGYDISDFYNVISDYGTRQDLQDLFDAAHARGLRVIMDLVLNHTSDQHPWFQAARSDPESPYRDYYVWSDTTDRYQDVRIIFLDTEDSNWTWDEKAGQYFWHRFYSTQPDLNFDNPAVRQEMLNVMKHWLDMGIDGFRADAVPYLIERDGTNCENLPETHAYLKEIRQYLNEHYPDRILLAEANQWPKDVIPYFGNGSNEFHMGFHFPLMPRIFMALRREDRTPLEWILNRTPAIPDSCQWCIFLRNHDELTLEMVTEEERQWMWEQYAPEPRMRLNLGIRRRLAPLLDNNKQKIMLAKSILFTMPGSPILYYGDEIGMGDDIWLPDRNGVRTPMQWNAQPGAGFSTASVEQYYSPLIQDDTYGPQVVNVESEQSQPQSLYNQVRHLIAVRKEHPVFGLGDFRWVTRGLAENQTAIAAYLRTTADESVLVVHNLSSSPQRATLDLSGMQLIAPYELLAGEKLTPLSHNHLDLKLEPFQFLWIQL
jgi:maltose alpha-D-glucosyltransferase / alpha-amylase